MMSQNSVDANYIWAIISVNALLLTIAGFFIRQWMSSIKEALKEQQEDLKVLERRHEEENRDLKLELGKRKGEIDLVKKDVEKLASDTLNNFENVKLHLSYQKTALDDIKSDAKDRKQDMDTNFKNIVELITNKGKS